MQAMDWQAGMRGPAAALHPLQQLQGVAPGPVLGTSINLVHSKGADDSKIKVSGEQDKDFHWPFITQPSMLGQTDVTFGCKPQPFMLGQILQSAARQRDAQSRSGDSSGRITSDSTEVCQLLQIRELPGTNAAAGSQAEHGNRNA